MLADRVRAGEPEAIEAAVAFVCRESRGHWHGRARAKLCRRFKHVALTVTQRDRVVTAVLERLLTGNFSEQFRDQLRTAFVFAPERARAAARAAAADPREYVRRLAAWVLSR